MAPSTSSANTQALFGYADATATMNSQLENEARLLSVALERFATHCTEYTSGVGPQLAELLWAYVQRVMPEDAWVREVATNFQFADASTLVPLILGGGLNANRWGHISHADAANNPLSIDIPSTSVDKAGNAFTEALYHFIGSAGTVWKSVEAMLKVLGPTTVSQIDKLMQHILNEVLQDKSGAKERITLELSGDCTIFIGEFPLKLDGAKTVTITHEDDGSYIVTVKSRVGGGVGVSAPLKAGATTGPEGEISFRYDPRKPGDMTQMAVALTALGATIPGLSIIALPAHAVLSRDNFHGVKGGFLLRADLMAKLGISLELQAAAKTGGALNRNEKGEWEVSSFAEGSLGGEVSAPIARIPLNAGGEIVVNREFIFNTTTQQRTVRLTLAVEGAVGTSPDLVQKLKSFLPPGTNLDLKAQEYKKLALVYSFDASNENIGALLRADDVASVAQVLRNASHIKLVETEGTRSNLSGGGSGALAGINGLAGVGVGGKIERETERERDIVIPPVKEEEQRHRPERRPKGIHMIE